MKNPYANKPDYQFWRRSFAGRSVLDVDLITKPKFNIKKSDKIATAGSCFAQHVSQTLLRLGFNYMVSEQAPAFSYSEDENYGVFSARYGNIYTVRQLKQLFQQAYGLFDPKEKTWHRNDGRYVDSFRPYIQKGGFLNTQELLADRRSHLDAVQNLFEDCDVFIFTLGLTEGWEAVSDGAVAPVSPGVVGVDGDDEAYRFHNFTVSEMEADLSDFLEKLHAINPRCKVLLTVSPVALIATYEDRHVLSATTYSKSALRVVAESMVNAYGFVDYFPSYEMILGPHSRGAFLADDLREVRPEGVNYAMSKFAARYLDASIDESLVAPAATAPTQQAIDRQRSLSTQIANIICDEERIDPLV